MEIAGFRSKYSDEQIEALLDAAANGGGGGASDLYFKKEDIKDGDILLHMIVVSKYTKFTLHGTTAITPSSALIELVAGLGFDATLECLLAFAIDPNSPYKWSLGDVTTNTVEEFLAVCSIDLNAYPHLTEEEFYNIN